MAKHTLEIDMYTHTCIDMYVYIYIYIENHNGEFSILF